MGDKAAARRLAASLGVPVLPGYDEPDQSDAALQSAADRIGYPVLVKPAAGGGGKGMRIVRDAGGPSSTRSQGADARPSRPSVTIGSSSSASSRAVATSRSRSSSMPRGTASTSGSGTARSSVATRRSSRRRPSPGVDEALRARLGEAALTLARAVGYVSAGTCEFLVDDRGRPAFLEMNTRLQVEHPVTELVTGRDLVADQLRIAAGEPLGFVQSDVASPPVTRSRSACTPRTPRPASCRRPGASRRSAGRPATASASMPGSTLGTGVGGRFDPMLAKIIAWGPTRDAGARPADDGPRRDARPRAGHEPAVPPLAGSPAAWSATERHGPTRSIGSGRRTTGPRDAAIPDEAWVGGGRGPGRTGTPTRGRPVGRRLAAQRRSARSAPLGRRRRDGRSGSTADRRADRRPSASVTSSTSTWPAGASAHPVAAAAGRRPDRARPARPSGGAVESPRPDARAGPGRPRRGRRHRRPRATRSSPSRR